MATGRHATRKSAGGTWTVRHLVLLLLLRWEASTSSSSVVVWWSMVGWSTAATRRRHWKSRLVGWSVRCVGHGMTTPSNLGVMIPWTGWEQAFTGWCVRSMTVTTWILWRLLLLLVSRSILWCVGASSSWARSARTTLVGAIVARTWRCAVRTVKPETIKSLEF